MKLSVIVPVYNTAPEDRLKHCLESLEAQTLADMEVIVVDDASTDDSPAVIKEFEERLSKERPGFFKAVYCKENHKQGGARNRGMKIASGDWIGFIDGDDFASPDMYEKLLSKGEKTGADVVGCDYTITDRYDYKPGQNVTVNTDAQTGVLDDEKHKSLIVRSGSCVTKIYRKSLIDENGLSFPEGIFYEDNCAGPLWTVYFKHFEYVREPLYHYLTVGTSTTHHVDIVKCRDRVKAGEIFLEECRRRGITDRFPDEVEFHFTECAYANTLFSYMYSGQSRKPAYTQSLKKMILKEYPEFRKNIYVKKFISEENRNFIDLQMKNNLLFFIKYVLLFKYRDIKKGRKSNA